MIRTSDPVLVNLREAIKVYAAALDEQHRRRMEDVAREAFRAGYEIASVATHRGGWEQAWEWSKIRDKVAQGEE